MRYLPALLILLASSCLERPALADDAEPRADFLMFEDPKLEYEVMNKHSLPPGAIELWRSSLKRPEETYRISAARDLLRALRLGFPEVKSATPELLSILPDSNVSTNVQLTVARTLVEFDNPEIAKPLFELAEASGSQFKILIEPALARWDYRPMREIWRARLENEKTFHRELILACEGSGITRDTEALQTLLKIVHSPARARDLRLAAARAAGQISEQQLERDAEQLLAPSTPALIDRLCAVSLLQRHDSPKALDLLRQLFADSNGSVAYLAIARLFEIDPALVLDLYERASTNSDAAVRRVAARSYITLPTVERLSGLSKQLDDPDPSLRREVRNALLRFSEQAEFAAPVRELSMQILSADGWRGQEQAALILGKLDYDPAADRLVELLASDRSEVSITAAWGLKQLAVPATLPAMLARATLQNDNPQSDDLPAVDRQMAHLFEAMAQMDYKPAIPLMRKLVPKILDHRRLSRAAACWSLGYLMAGQSDDQFEKQLMDRAADDMSLMPEIEIVRWMCAVSLGRLKAESQLDALINKIGPTVEYFAPEHAMLWAIRQLGGPDVPLREPPADDVMREWLIQPLTSNP